MTNIAEQTLAAIVTEHHQVVPVLEKYHLDFCCKGKRTLTEACTEKGLAVDDIMKELEASSHTKEAMNIPFAEMNAEQLVRHILLHHHFYVRQSMPGIQDHLSKVAIKHGEHFPYMKDVFELFTNLKNELSLHMQKEEVMLFPRIKEIEALHRYDQKRVFIQNYIYGPVFVMENEHDEAGAIMEQIRLLTNDYTPPAGACTTFCVVLSELRAFEEDLHQHVHLENNLLFPLGERMLKEINVV